MKRLIIIFILLYSFEPQAQTFYSLKGYVYSEENQPLPGANIRVFDSQTGTQTNENGQYELSLEDGLHRLTVTFLGFESQTFEIVIEKDLVKNIILKASQTALSEVKVQLRNKDFSYEVIKNVIENKENYLKQYKNYKSLVYIKSLEEPKDTKPPRPNKNKEENENPLDIKPDSLPGYNYFEANITRFAANPNLQKEERTAIKKIGDQSTLFFTSTVDGEFDLYKNMQQMNKIGENFYVSPISPLGYVSYKFKMLDTYHDGKRLVYRISIKPKKLGNALYEGEIEVLDGLWVLKSVNLKLNKRSLLIYDAFSFTQKYEKVNEKWMISSETFDWKIKEGAITKTGRTEVSQSEFVFDSTYSKNFFGSEIGKTTAQAYKRDSTFWEQIRPIPLSKTEHEVIKKEEAYQIKISSKSYLDSIDAIYNKITFPKVGWKGVGHINRAKKRNIEFQPIVGLLNPVAIGGWRAQYSINYFKRYENRKEFNIRPYINYGFRNKDLRGQLNLNYLYNPIKRSRLSVFVGQGFDVINGAATISDILKRNNFYIYTGLNINHKTELLNGFYLSTNVAFSQRKDFSGFQFAKLGDDLFEDNDPTLFPKNNLYSGGIGLEYTPKQLYTSEPNEKIILGSRYPTFGISLEQAWNKSGAAFSNIEFTASQYFNVGILGTSEYKVSIGKFLDTTSMAPMDYKYQRGGDPIWFSPSMSTYQLIPNTFKTLDWVLESHYEHQFNGFLTSKVPLINKTGIKTVAGAGFIYVPKEKYRYAELFAGVNRIFKLGKARFRLGAYYVTAQSNQFGYKSGFKFSFEPYDRAKNTWSF